MSRRACRRSERLALRTDGRAAQTPRWLLVLIAAAVYAALTAATEALTALLTTRELPIGRRLPEPARAGPALAFKRAAALLLVMAAAKIVAWAAAGLRRRPRRPPRVADLIGAGADRLLESLLRNIQSCCLRYQIEAECAGLGAKAAL